MITVHLVFNAHVDPVWLWPWQAGLDETLATCRSACDRLDAHPELVFTRGEAWIYQQIERLDPRLFQRIVQHVQAGRWEITGGWWIQPDCNAPSGFAMQKQIALGKQYFLDRFGSFPTIAYNVDSFGHAATLPGYMRAAGQSCYVMMRPQEHEMALPSRLFRWRGYEEGPEVLTFRIAGVYCNREMTEAHIRSAMTELPPGVEHTMCFVGVGDHGGGPTEGQIRWVKEHINAIDGCRLIFSSPRRFFDAVAGSVPSLPLVTGELQHHAIGCYSVYRPVKLAVRRSEHLLRQAEVMNAKSPTDAGLGLPEAWKRVCFNHFHDTLGGTCLPSAYRQVLAQLGYAQTVADDVLQLGLRKKLAELPDDKLQRMVAFNASEEPFEGWIEAEPWLDWRKWDSTWRLLDEQGLPIPHQLMQGEAVTTGGAPRLLLHRRIEPGDWRVVRLEQNAAQPADSSAPAVQASASQIGNPLGAVWTPAGLQLPQQIDLPLPRLDLIADTSDTWSHSIDRYGEQACGSATWKAPVLADQGPLMASILQNGQIGQSRLRAEWRVYADGRFVELQLGVHWLERNKVLKLCIPLPHPTEQRIDGILGGHLQRPNIGREVPLRDWMLLDAGAGRTLGIVCPDVFAADVTPQRIRLTLLRSPVMVHHDPHPPTAFRAQISDQGEHCFRFRFWSLQGSDVRQMELEAMQMQRPPVIADLTRGMPLHFREC